MDADEKITGVITRTDSPEDPSRRTYRNTWGAPVSASVRRSFKKLMRDKLPEWVMKLLKDAGETACELGFRAYAVGGFVSGYAP